MKFAPARPGQCSRPLFLLLNLLLATSLRAEVSEGLAAYWPLDQSSGMIAVDATTNGCAGVLRNFPGAVEWWPGRVGESLFFGGTTAQQYVLVDRYPPLSTVSVAAWVLAESHPVWASILKNWGGSQTGQFHFGLNSSDGALSCYVTLEDGSQAMVRESSPLPLGSWQHVAFTMDGTMLRLFRNGLEVGAVPVRERLIPARSPALGMGVKLNDAGTEPDTGSPGFWHGRLDELALWSRALSIEEIDAVYRAGLQGRPLPEAQTGPVVTGSGVRLSEFMASNSRTLEDDFGEDSDWIELHNDLTNTVNLSGWSLTDDPNLPMKWIFPDTNLPPGKFLVVFASGRDRRAAGSPLHSNFRLSAGGEYLALRRGDGSVADAFTSALPQIADVSFGFPATYLGDPGFLLQPTPGAPNLDASMLRGPLLSSPAYSPLVLRTNGTLQLSCRVTPLVSPISNVTAHLRFMFDPEITVPMHDDGLHGDGSASDHVFGALVTLADLPAKAAPETMVRWRFTSQDQARNVSRLPFHGQPRSAEYFGTLLQAGDSPTSAVPVLHWFVESPAAADTDSGTTCCLFYEGQFRDNCEVRIRGGSARHWPRKSYKFDLNPGEKLRMRTGGAMVGEFNLNSPYTDKSYVRSVLASDFLSSAGLPTPQEFHLRVFRNGLFHSLGIYVEQMDDDFLERQGLDPSGAYYKAQGDPLGTYEKKSRPSEDDSDLKDFLAGLEVTGPDLEAFLFDNVNVANVVNYMAATAILQNIDGSDKNHYLHRDTLGSGEWRILPWDLDLTFGPDYLNTDTIVFNLCDVFGVHCPSHPFIGVRPYLLHPGKYHPLLEAIVKSARAREMVLRRIRTLRDDFLATPYFEERIEALFHKLAPDVSRDRQLWGANAHFPGKTYTLRQALDRLKTEYVTPRSKFLDGVAIPGIGTAMPASQDQTVTVSFGRLESGLQLRDPESQFVELVNSNSVALDISGWSLGGAVSFTFAPGTIVPSGGSVFAVRNAAAFRSRTVSPRGGMGLFVQGNYSGALTSGGGLITLSNSHGELIAETVFPPVQPDLLRLARTPGAVHLLGRGQPAIRYQVERKGTLADPSWTLVGSAAADSTGAIHFLDATAQDHSAFYRLRAEVF